MSQMEYNKGKLVLETRSVEEVAEEVVVLLPNWYTSKVDYFNDDAIYDSNYTYINGTLHRVEWEVRKGELDELRNVEVEDNGDINFETYHYNGGGDWVEVVESCLKEIKWCSLQAQKCGTFAVNIET